MIDGYFAAWEKYATFAGRARRREYWGFCLCNFVVTVVIVFLSGLTGKAELAATLVGIYSLAAFLPTLSVLVRRLHDIGKSGWWCLVAIIPFIGVIWLLVLLCIEGTLGANAFGEDSKQRQMAD